MMRVAVLLLAVLLPICAAAVEPDEMLSDPALEARAREAAEAAGPGPSDYLLPGSISAGPSAGETGDGERLLTQCGTATCKK